MASDNKSLGRFILDGIPPAPRGMPQIEVTFDIDANGILHVTAKDKATGKEQKITITGSTGLDKDEIERMTKEAEANAEADKKKKEEIEVRNNADTLIYTTERALKDAEGKISDDIKKEVEDKLKELKDIKDTGSLEDVKAKADSLAESAQKIGEAMYKQQEAAKEGGTAEEAKTEETTGEEKKEEEKKEAVEGEVVDEGGEEKKEE